MPVSYSIVCEDVAHAIFIKQFVALHYKERFELNERCFNRYFKPRNRKAFLNDYTDVATQSFRTYKIELMFAATDFDDHPQDEYKSIHEKLVSDLPESLRHKTVVALPVRCIEHWLRLLQWRDENPEGTKVVTYEGEPRNESKETLYGRRKPSREKQEEVITALLRNLSIEWLCSRSQSFNHFSTTLATAMGR